MVYAQPRIRPWKWDAQNSLGFWETNGSSNLSQTSRSSDNQQEKKKKEERERTCRIVEFAVLADHRVKLKESKKRNKYLDFARELKNYGTWKWQRYYLPTPPLGQDMTQGQFLSGV